MGLGIRFHGGSLDLLEAKKVANFRKNTVKKYYNRMVNGKKMFLGPCLGGKDQKKNFRGKIPPLRIR